MLLLDCIDKEKFIEYSSYMPIGKSSEPMGILSKYMNIDIIIITKDIEHVLYIALKNKLRANAFEHNSRITSVIVGRSKYISIYNFIPNYKLPDEINLAELWAELNATIADGLTDLNCTDTVHNFYLNKFNSIASIAYSAFIESSDLFSFCPYTSAREYNTFKPAYKAGYVYAVSGIHYNINQIDRRSAYPYIYGYAELPIGHACKIEPNAINNYPFYIVNITAVFTLKKGKFATVAPNTIFGTTSYLDTVQEPITLTLCRQDFELFINNYDCDFSVNWAYGWNTASNIFQRYADTLVEHKNNAIGFRRQVIKDLVNTPYGKLGTNGERTLYQYSYNAVTDTVDKTVIGFNKAGRSFQNLPLAICIVAQQRADLINTAQAYAKENILYMDTDSIKGRITPPPDNGNIGEWADECKRDIFVVRAKKHYSAYDKNTRTASYTCAGVPAETIQAIYKLDNVSEQEFLTQSQKFLSDKPFKV